MCEGMYVIPSCQISFQWSNWLDNPLTFTVTAVKTSVVLLCENNDFLEIGPMQKCYVCEYIDKKAVCHDN